VAYTGRRRIVGIVLIVAMILLGAFSVTEIAFCLAFLIFYSLHVIVFAALYRIVEGVLGEFQLLVAGDPDTTTFSEVLYFSLISARTVGYCDITPMGPGASAGQREDHHRRTVVACSASTRS